MTCTKKILGLSVVTLLTPIISFAALDGVNALLTAFGNLVGKAIPIAFALGVLFFFWGVARFILASSNPAAKAQGKDIMVWGVIALFVMASVWGLVKFLGESLGIATPVKTNSVSSPLDQCQADGTGCE